VRAALGIIAVALTFVPAYREIMKASSESWITYLVAFQNGFFCLLHFVSEMLREEAALDPVARHFTR
jgi:hypothetical protein